MALVVADRVQETSLTSGTGTLTLVGAVAGFQTFSTAIGNGNTTFYTIYDSTAYDWEVGIGTVGAGTLARTTVLSNSAGTTSPISFAGNSKFVFCTYPAEKSINYDANGVATIGDVLGYSDTGIVGSFASTVAGYNQVIVQNKSTATNASSNLNVSNDAGTAGSNYAELGINSSTFTGSGSFNIAGASYVASASTDLTLGTYGAYNVHFVTNSNTTDAMTIFNDGGISLGGFANPGIGNMAASKFVPGYTAVTSAAGTTVLTEDSNYYQNLLGSTTQTFQLPDATTLLVGTTFIFDNDSSGTLTVVDNASGPIETIPGGAASFVYLAVNATVAGTWRRHSFLPASYDFNATTANFGTATITNASWNGNTIGTAYGGTGLTSFGSANYALYSTSSSALVAGTLPVAAGGTALTSYTTGDVIYASTTNTLAKLPIGTTGQVLSVSGGIPSWSTPSANVSSFQTSLSGLTPSTATTGAVTLAGTLGPTSGGTGTSTAFTTGSVVFAGASGTYTEDNANLFWDDTNNRLGIGTTSPDALLTVNTIASFGDGAVGAPSIAHKGDLNTGMWFPAADTIAFSTNGSERMRIDSGGNVAIRTTTSSSRLDINSTSNWNFSVTNLIRSASNTNSPRFIGMTLDGDSLTSTTVGAYNAIWGVYDSAPTTGSTSAALNGAMVYAAYAGHRWVNNGTERMRISAAGGVSIGTTTDAGATNLLVAGNVTAPQFVASNGLFVNAKTVSANYTIPTNYNASSTGPVTVATGISVTIPSGSRWVVL